MGDGSSGDCYDSEDDDDYCGNTSNSNEDGSDMVDEDSAVEVEDVEVEEGLSDNAIPDGSIQLSRDKEWLDKFIKETMKSGITKVELEIDNIRNKKIRGTTKK